MHRKDDMEQIRNLDPQILGAIHPRCIVLVDYSEVYFKNAERSLMDRPTSLCIRLS